MLSGKSCLITGASSGIGKTIALTYAKEGATLFLAARNQDRLKQVSEKCKDAGANSVEYICKDLSSIEAAEDLAKIALEKFSTVDVLVNSAGISVYGQTTCLEGNPKVWEQMMYINALIPMTLMHYLTPGMVKQRDGVVVNIGSLSGKEIRGNIPVYAATKWALQGWSLSCHEELRKHNIKVCMINPSYVSTDMISGVKNMQLEDTIDPEDVAEVALLPFKLSAKCVPTDIELRLMRNPIRSMNPPPHKNRD